MDDLYYQATQQQTERDQVTPHRSYTFLFQILLDTFSRDYVMWSAGAMGL